MMLRSPQEAGRSSDGPLGRPRSPHLKREAGREHVDIRPVGETDETPVRQTLGALLGERDEGLDVARSRVGGGPDCRDSRICEKLYRRVPAGWGDLGGVNGEGHSVVRSASAERPPRQAGEDTSLTCAKAHVLVEAPCRVEKRPRPSQIAQPTSNRRLTHHQVGRLQGAEAACKRLFVQTVGGGVVSLPGPQRRKSSETEKLKATLSRTTGPLQQRLVVR